MNLITALLLMAVGATVTLNWQASTDPHTVGYLVHYDNYSSGLLGKTIDVGNVTSVTFTHISTNRLYCFASSIYANVSGQIYSSGYSNKQCGTIQPHVQLYGMPNYRTSGSPVYDPANPAYNPVPTAACGQCH